MTIVTLSQLEAIADAALEYHMDRGKVYWQNDQSRQILTDMMANAKSFPGGKDNLTVRVADEYQTGIQGFEYDDTVTYDNPAKLKTATYPWKLIHGGINVTMHELLTDGISIADTTDGSGERRLSGRDKQVLANLFDYKIEDMKKGMDKELDEMFVKDGSSDSKLVPGLRSILLDDPTSATTVGGIDQAANDKWRNYADTGISTGTPSDLNISTALQKGWRQMRRYGTNAKVKMYAGSDFLEALEDELRAKGTYTDNGFTGSRDMSVGDLRFKGTPIAYTPTLDDLSLSKYMFCVDWNNIYPMYIEGENMKAHRPARPEDKYVLYRAVTWVGGLVARQRNTSGVFSIA